MEKISKSIDSTFKGIPGMEVIADAAKNLISAIHETDKLKQIIRWQSRQIIQTDPGGQRSIGVEIHYKLKIFEETKLEGIPMM